MFSKTCEYGIKATLFIAQRSQEGIRVSLKEIAQAIDSPEAFTAKILQSLVKANVIDSYKGPKGGFSIEKAHLERISLKEVVVALDGSHLFNVCVLGLDKCNAKQPCPVHNQFVGIREQLNATLANTSLSQVAEELKTGESVLKI